MKFKKTAWAGGLCVLAFCIYGVAVLTKYTDPNMVTHLIELVKISVWAIGLGVIADTLSAIYERIQSFLKENNEN